MHMEMQIRQLVAVRLSHVVAQGIMTNRDVT